ncbi:3'-5' exoribonuclease 1-like isoform X2 [Antedon mediterranea]|uniref:3'-5' exoribonuclease 1-like isoform X2 n=1 Tax=Antedon mediterranea TaxID=105859 RepID=UPI003AF788D8
MTSSSVEAGTTRPTACPQKSRSVRDSSSQGGLATLDKELKHLCLDDCCGVHGDRKQSRPRPKFTSTDQSSGVTSRFNNINKIDKSHPVFKQISRKNGEINKLNASEVKAKLGTLKLNTRGRIDILKSRLKSYYKQRQLAAESGFQSMHQQFDYLLVIDYEATCEEPEPPDFVPEIIEFPIVLINTSTLEVEDEFQAFCRPTFNPKLTQFCTDLTSITQSMVDSAELFPDVWKKVCKWMDSKGLGTYYTFAVACDGPWDMNLFLNVQCHLSQVPFPNFCRKWVNICKAMSNFYHLPRMSLKNMLTAHELTFEGRPHRGISDARNIARIAVILMEDGCILDCNDSFDTNFSPNAH